MPFVRPAAAAAALALLAAGCGGACTTSSTATTTSTAAAKGHTVALHVVHQGEATIALVQVTIGGKGPYAFALDTGAAHSAIDVELAKKLGLERVGQTKVSGVVKTDTVPQFRIGSWKVDGLKLKENTVSGTDLQRGDGPGLAGLLGSDVLSRFQRVTIDYDAQTLLLVD